jgi:hypothetical protein
VPAELTLHFQSGDSAATDDFVDVVASVSCRGFAGSTRFSIARRDLVAFASDVAALERGANDLAQLLGGWEAAEERLRLKVTRAGTSGLFAARIRLASLGARTDQWDKVETQFVCDRAALTRFVEQLAARKTAALSGDEDSTE